MQTKDGNQLSGESNTESNEKIIKRLNKNNAWLNYLKTGKKLKPALKPHRTPYHGVFLSGKQKRAFRSGEKDPVFTGSLNSKQRKAILKDGE